MIFSLSFSLNWREIDWKRERAANEEERRNYFFTRVCKLWKEKGQTRKRYLKRVPFSLSLSFGGEKNQQQQQH